MKCPLHIASYALRIGVSVMDSEFFIGSVYISIARTGNACLFAEAIPIIVTTGYNTETCALLIVISLNQLKTVYLSPSGVNLRRKCAFSTVTSLYDLFTRVVSIYGEMGVFSVPYTTSFQNPCTTVPFPTVLFPPYLWFT